MGVKLLASSNGSVELVPANTASDFTVTVPAATTTMVGTDTTQTLTNKTIQGGSITSGTAVASTSGTSIDFTGIPSWVKRITVMFSGVSTSATSLIQIQLGDAGGFEITGYVGSASSGTSATTNSAGFLVTANLTAATTQSGVITISSLGSNVWAQNGCLGFSNASAVNVSGGTKTLSDTLTQVRITTVNGTDTFDAGTINILYE